PPAITQAHLPIADQSTNMTYVLPAYQCGSFVSHLGARLKIGSKPLDVFVNRSFDLRIFLIAQHFQQRAECLQQVGGGGFARTHACTLRSVSAQRRRVARCCPPPWRLGMSALITPLLAIPELG